MNPPNAQEPSTTTTATSPPPSRRLARFTTVLAIGTFLVVLAGGTVSSTESGLADHHWPTFEGSWFPSIRAMLEDNGKLFEHGHRIVAGVVVASTWALAIILLRRGERRWVVRTAFTSGVFGLVLAGFGGLAVLLDLPPAVSVVHVSLAMVFLSLNTTLAVVTGPFWYAGRVCEKPEGEAQPAAPAREDRSWLLNAAWICLGTVYVQIVLGAVLRHAHVGFFVHVFWAFIVVTAVFMLAGRILGRHSDAERLLNPAMALALLLAAQFFLGLAAFITLPDDPAVVGAAGVPDPGSGFHQFLATTHQAAGALTLVVSVVLVLRVLRVNHWVGLGILSAAEEAGRGGTDTSAASAASTPSAMPAGAAEGEGSVGPVRLAGAGGASGRDGPGSDGPVSDGPRSDGPRSDGPGSAQAVWEGAQA